MIYKNIETSWGVLRKRNSIYLDSVYHEVDNANLNFKGQISNTNLSQAIGEQEWIDYECIFNIVLAYKCIEIDSYFNIEVKSSFDEVEDSEWISELELSNDEFHHYVFSTYDYIYEIIAKGFEFK